MKTFWNIMLGLGVVLALVSFAENMYVLNHAPEAAKRKCANAHSWVYRGKYTNCLRNYM